MGFPILVRWHLYIESSSRTTLPSVLHALPFPPLHWPIPLFTRPPVGRHYIIQPPSWNTIVVPVPTQTLFWRRIPMCSSAQNHGNHISTCWWHATNTTVEIRLWFTTLPRGIAPYYQLGLSVIRTWIYNFTKWFLMRCNYSFMHMFNDVLAEPPFESANG